MTIAERIETAQALIARLEGEHQAAVETQDQARVTRQGAALAAVEGDEEAKARLAEATAIAAAAVVEAENLTMALTAARERLAGLEVELLAEDREAQRLLNIERCYQRVALAGQIDALLAEVAPLVEQWSELGAQLYNAKSNGEPGVVGAGDLFMRRSVLKHALPPVLSNAIGLSVWVGDHRLLAEADPAAMTVRHAEDRPNVIAYPNIAEQVLEDMNRQAAAERQRPPRSLHQALDDPTATGSEAEIMAGREGLDALADLVVVDRLPGGGAVFQSRAFVNVPRDEPDPSAPAAAIAPVPDDEGGEGEAIPTPISQEAA